MYFKTDEMERRCLPTSELRIGIENSQPKIYGYAAVFDTWADIGGMFRESIRRGAFAKTVKENDVRALLNHDPNFVLGRNKAGTLRLREDKKGLAVEIDPTPTTWANDLMVSMKRGDVTQMSFGFTVNDADKDYEKGERVLTDVTLFDVSVVTYPAYPTTSAEVRSAFAKKLENRHTDMTASLTFSIEDTTEPKDDPPGFSELDRIIRKLIRKEELTEEELRAVAAHYPDLSAPPAQHAETPPAPPAKHVEGDTRKGTVAELLIRASRLPNQTTTGKEVVN